MQASFILDSRGSRVRKWCAAGLGSLVMGVAAMAPAAASPPGEQVALQAGRIYLVEAGQVIENGTVLVKDGRIVAVGAEVQVPRGVRVVDYGPDAVLTPGLVAADSTYGSTIGAERTASPTLRAADHFDPFNNMRSAAKLGVTSLYLAPARGRLIAGQGAVVKSFGDEDGGNSRMVSESACLHGSISAEARRTPGYWEIPIPATVDVGLGVEQPQLPRSTMGAIVALEELMGMGPEALAAEYGPATGPSLSALNAAGTPWRMGASSLAEVCALLEFFGKSELPLVLDSDYGASEKAEVIAAAGVAVIAGPQGLNGPEFGAGQDSAWPDPTSVSTLVQAGVRVAIVSRKGVDIRSAAALARKGGMTAAQALESVTLIPAQVLGVADRVGSIVVGKDADFTVFNGEPTDATTSVLATWVAGEVAHQTKDGDTVLEVEELHLGDGHVLRPGQLLLSGGKIAEVGTMVAHPRGATVVRGVAAMPGMIDALGQLGLDGSTSSIDPKFDLRRILEAGNHLDRRVAKAGITTVNLGSKAASSITMAYKPAGSDLDAMVVSRVACIRLNWNHSNRASVGASVRTILGKAAAYKKKWEEYNAAMAKWSPPAPEPSKEGEDDEESEDKDEATEDSDKKQKKDKDAPQPPVTGEWRGQVSGEQGTHELRVRLLESDLALEGTLRGGGLDELVALSGTREDKHVQFEGESSLGLMSFDLEVDGKEMEGTASLNGSEGDVTLAQVSEVYPVAKRPGFEKPGSVATPKGKPKNPGIDPSLEPLRQAMYGKGAVIVAVDREDDIRNCVDTFASHGIRPILWRAQGASSVVNQIKDRVAGVINSTSPAALARAGIPVAFASNSEQGAAMLPQTVARLVTEGLSPTAAMRALTSDAATMFVLDQSIGRLRAGMAADVLLLDGSPLQVNSSIQRVWVNGTEIR